MLLNLITIILCFIWSFWFIIAIFGKPKGPLLIDKLHDTFVHIPKKIMIKWTQILLGKGTVLIIINILELLHYIFLNSTKYIWLILYNIILTIFVMQIFPFIPNNFVPEFHKYIILAVAAPASFITFLIAVFSNPGDTKLQKLATKLKFCDKITEQETLKYRSYCSVCHIYIYNDEFRHCKICGTCIPDFNHHCLWIGNCVSKHNLPKFLLFLFTCSLSSFYAFIIGFLTLSSNNMNIFLEYTQNIKLSWKLQYTLFFNYPWIYLACITCCLSAIIKLSFALFYCSILVLYRQTTYKYFRHMRSFS
ncbi:hypothetical protein ACR3K2_26470 [Cryptosporidium serpentis]